MIPLHTPTPTGCSCGRQDCGQGKHPRTRHGLDEATTNEARIRSWWRMWPTANIGILCGAESNLVVLDVDPEHNGDVMLAALEQQFGELPHTVESVTGGGGRHVFFSHPGGTIRNAVGLGGFDGLDLRGDGGYVVAAPSLHHSGQRYAWEATHHPDDTLLMPLPDWITTLLKAPISGNGNRPGAIIGERIPTGQRNQTLTSLAGTMRRRGMPEAAILAALLTVNSDQCDPPLPVKDVETIAASVASYAPAPTAPPAPALHAAAAGQTFNLTDMGNAERLVARYGKQLRYCYASGKWLVWDGRRWCDDDGGEVDRYAKLTVRSIYAEAAREPDDGARKALADHARRSEFNARIEGMLKRARSEPDISVQPRELDANYWLLNCQNGILNLVTGTLEPHRPEALCTKIVAASYDPAATCPTWLAFLDRIMAGNRHLIAFLQRSAGYALTGATMEQCLFMLHGGGMNGKTTYLGTLRALLSDYGQQATFETFLHKDRETVPSDIARMAGARLVIAIEASEGKRLAEAVIKQLTGQDTVTARFLFHEFFEFIPQFKIFLAVNHKPVIRETTAAMWRRIHLVPFSVQISEEEKDKSLPDRLKGELSGILTWAVQGCLDWQRHGLGVPEEVTIATTSYRDEMDVLGGFFNDCCLLARSAKATAKDLYIKYKLWCVDNDEKPMTQMALGMRLSDRGLQRVKNQKGNVVWCGIGLQDSQDSESQSEMLLEEAKFTEALGVTEALGGLFQSYACNFPRMERTPEKPPEPPKPPSFSVPEMPPESESKASVPFTITAKDWQKLRDLGYSDEELYIMKPEQARKLLDG